MRTLRKVILAGAAVIALAGAAGLAAAELKNAHVLAVQLPDGSVARIRYVGDTPPTVSFTPAPIAFSIPSPASDPFVPESPFAALERMSGDMGRGVDAIFREVSAQPAMAIIGPDLMQVDVGKLPPGVQGFSMVSTISGNGICTRSVQYRSPGEGRPPQVATQTSGACTADQRRPALSVTSGSASETSQHDGAGRQPVIVS
ncbi:hypothetical protein [Phenylobacterium sp.]|uniref:hypothetical protein n=1 Tax=Phenylobacterium sp. TaxID=1871053 RepID=UPI00286C77A2|nr:hypothetical protein [Phenylobacterium sp.]